MTRHPENRRHSRSNFSLLSQSAFIFLTSMVLQNTLLKPIHYTPWVVAQQVFCSLVAGYLPSFFDGSERTTQGRPSPWVMGLGLWQWAFRGSQVIYTTPLSPSSQYIFCLHPHGVSSSSHWFLACIEFFKKFPNKRHLGAEIIFKIPIYRDLMLGAGIIDAGRATTERALQEGKTLVLLPGGLSEQVRAQYKSHMIYIRNRSGIFYYALKYNIPIVPIYSFTENELYYTSGFLQSIRNWIGDTLWVPLCLCFPAKLPRNLRLYCGRPIYPHEVLSNTAIEATETVKSSKSNTDVLPSDRVHEKEDVLMHSPPPDIVNHARNGIPCRVQLYNVQEELEHDRCVLPLTENTTNDNHHPHSNSQYPGVIDPPQIERHPSQGLSSGAPNEQLDARMNTHPAVQSFTHHSEQGGALGGTNGHGKQSHGKPFIGYHHTPSDAGSQHAHMVQQQHTLSPTKEQVELLKELYIAEIQRVFDTYKADEGYPNATLTIL